MTSKDPSQDIYKMFDEVRLEAGYLLTTHTSTAKMVAAMRTELNKKICEYIAQDRIDRPGVTPPRDFPTAGMIVPPAPSATNESEFPL